mmetsp:Transcript_105258/g.296366  ORF Transcript_105258/g.296366 Transcript_105258/m.296366 type:complete len:158 (+) Transcript_105258:101-574(+)
MAPTAVKSYELAGRHPPRRIVLPGLLTAVLACVAVTCFPRFGGAPPAPPQPALTIDLQRLSTLQEDTTAAVERAGGTRTLIGSTVVGAITGTIVCAPLPILNQFGAILGAAAGAYCAQLPKDSMYGKYGEICRDLGRAATAFWSTFQKEQQNVGKGG